MCVTEDEDVDKRAISDAKVSRSKPSSLVESVGLRQCPVAVMGLSGIQLGRAFKSQHVSELRVSYGSVAAVDAAIVVTTTVTRACLRQPLVRWFWLSMMGHPGPNKPIRQSRFRPNSVGLMEGRRIVVSCRSW